MVQVLTQLTKLATATTAVVPALGKHNSYNAAGGALAPVLPPLTSGAVATALAAGQVVRLKVSKSASDASANPVTVTCTAPNTFESGATTAVLTLAGEKLTLTAATIPGAGGPTWVVEEHTVPVPTLSGTYARVVNGVLVSQVLTNGTDQTATINTELAALYAAGGGTWQLPRGNITIAGQIIVPNNGGLIPPPQQPPMIWKGVGGHYNGENAGLGSGGTRLILTYQNATYNNAKIVTRGLGVFRMQDIVFQDTTAASTTPFLFTTLTTLKISDCAFLGASSGTSCAQDAIVLGGTLKYPILPVAGNGYGDPDAPFQGYGTTIRGNYFSGVRRAVYGRSYCNQVVIADNFFDKGCGTNLVGGACLEFDASLTNAHPGDPCAANVITGNYFEWTGGYYYQVKMTGGAWSYIAGNAGEDPSPGGVAVALVGLFGHTITAVNYPSVSNYLIGNHSLTGVVLFEDAMSTGQNTVIGGNYGAGGGNKFAIGDELTLGEALKVPPAAWSLKTTAGDSLLSFIGAARATWMYGPVTLVGNPFGGGAGTTYLTLGNATTVSDAVAIFNPPAGSQCQIQWKQGGVVTWLIYDAGASALIFFRDMANAKMHMTLTAGAGAGGGSTEFNSAVQVDGAVGFYGHAPAAKPTVAGSRAANAALASLLTALAGQGLLTDSSTV